MNDKMVIRLAEQRDLPAILELNIEEYWEEKSLWEKASPLERIHMASWWGEFDSLLWHYNLLLKTQGGIICCFNGETLLGHLDFAVSDDLVDGEGITRLHIIWLLVGEQHRQSGIAISMIEFLKDYRRRNDLDQIWVEAEDQRSDSLYRKVMINRVNIENWYAHSYSKVKLPKEVKIESRDLDPSFMDEIPGNYAVLLGKYHTPNYDLAQLIFADESIQPVSQLIWGDLPPAKILKYQVENGMIYAIMTQYPRIYVKGKIKKNNIVQIVKDICNKILDLGFEQVYFQTLQSDETMAILTSCGFTQIDQDDFLYLL